MSYRENSDPRDEVVWTDWKPLPPHISPAQRLWIISDVHGRMSDLSRLLMLKDDGYSFIMRPYTDLLPGTRLVFLGNMIDQGPDSCSVMRYLHRFPELEKYTFQGEHFYGRGSHPECTLLWGEHEACACACLYPEACQVPFDLKTRYKLWEEMGGRATLSSIFSEASGDETGSYWFDLRPYAQQRLAPYFSALQRYFLSRNVLLCPAGLPPKTWLDFFMPMLPVGQENTWLNYRCTNPVEQYRRSLYDPYDYSRNEFFMIFGHTPVKLTEAQAKYALAVNLDAPLMALIELEPAAENKPDEYHPEIPDEDKNRAYYRYRLTGIASDDPDAITPEAAAAILNAQQTGQTGQTGKEGEE